MGHLTLPTERRYTKAVPELRAEAAGRKIVGLGAVFSRYSQNLGGFVEEVTPPAFNRSKGMGWPGAMARYNHDDNMLLGTTGGGTLQLEVSALGLHYEIDPPVHRADVVELVQRGDVRKSSFAFRTPSGGDEWGLTENGYPLRSLLSVELVDVAPVNTPAYLDSDAALRSLARHAGATMRDVERAVQADEIRRLLVRTDGGGPRLQVTPPAVVDLGDRRPVRPARDPHRLLALLEHRKRDPYDTTPPPSTGPLLSGAEAMTLTASRRFDPSEAAA